MEKFLWFTVVLLVLRGGSSYILLTANVEDVQSVLKQLTNSPLVDQVRQIWRRASSQFKQELNRPLRHGRIDSDNDLDEHEDRRMTYRRRNLDALQSLSENATQYVESARQFVESLNS